MGLTVGEKVKIILGRRNMTIADLADMTGQSRQNMSNKINRDNFQEQDIKKMASALNCDVEVKFSFKDTGEQI